ncbi:MAG: hypothetical protein ABI358_09610 [Ginsengibacter sp.]
MPNLPIGQAGEMDVIVHNNKRTGLQQAVDLRKFIEAMLKK